MKCNRRERGIQVRIPAGRESQQSPTGHAGAESYRQKLQQGPKRNTDGNCNGRQWDGHELRAKGACERELQGRQRRVWGRIPAGEKLYTAAFAKHTVPNAPTVPTPFNCRPSSSPTPLSSVHLKYREIPWFVDRVRFFRNMSPPRAR